MSGPSYEPPHYRAPGADAGADTSSDADRRADGSDVGDAPDDLLDRIDALLPPDGDERRGSIVPSADIWDDDDEQAADAGTGTLGADDDLGDDGDDDDDEWLPDAQEVVHGPDGEPYGEPFDDPLYDGRSDPAMASRMARWGRDSAMGAGMAGFGRAIQNILQNKESTEIVIQVEANRDSPDDPVTVHLVEDHPEESVAIVRPWLLGVPRRRRRRPAANKPTNLE